MNVANQVLVLFFLMVIGYAARKAKVVDDVAVDRFSSFILNVTLPCLIVASLQKPFSPALLREAGLMLGLSVGVYVLSVALAFLAPGALRAPQRMRGVIRFALVFSNVAFMGFPVVGAVLGPDALFDLAIYNIPFYFLAFSLGAWLLARDGNKKVAITWTLLVNPNVVATAVGFAFFLGSLALPTPILRTLLMTGEITTPLSMIAIGAILARMDAKSVLGQWRYYAVSALRLAVLPVLVWGALYLCGFRGLALALPPLVAAMPVAANCTIQANVYGGDVESAGALVFLTTVLCVATIPLAALLLR